MFPSDLPPGVTGNEYQIAGAESESDEYLECVTCNNTTLHYVEKHFSFGARAICYECDTEQDVTPEADPDEWRDER
jgi:hypothetical protein